MSIFEEKALLMILKLKTNGVNYEFLERNCNGTKTFEELFSLVWDLEDSHKELTPKLRLPGKSMIESELYTHVALDNFREKNYFKALKLINMGIVSAPHPVIRSSEDDLSSSNNGDIFSPFLIPAERYGGIRSDDSLCLSLAYAERSFMLFGLKVYEKCLKDIDLALQCGQKCLPDDIRGVLEDRKLNCLRALNTISSDYGIGTLKSSKQEYAELSPKKPMPIHLQELEKTLNLTSKLTINEPDVETLTSLINCKMINPPKLKEPNPTLPSLSNSLAVSYEASKGRNIKATRNIRPGEVLGVERAYVTCINVENLLLYCSSCFGFCFLPIPCPTCNKVIFCSESCRIRSLQEEHWIECVVLQTMNVYGVGYRNIVYKLLKTTSFSRLRDLLKELQNEKDESPENFGFDKNGIYSSTSYKAVHYLCTNKEKLSFEFLFPPCQLAFFITKLLHLSGRFFIEGNGQPKEPTREDLLKTGAVLVAHILQVRSNCFGLGDLKGDVCFGSRKTVGMGIFPTLSLINHSCNASTKAYNHGRFLVLRALRPIAAGEDITISYVPNSLDEGKENRKKYLQKYCFVCHCEACENDWPCLSKMPNAPDEDKHTPRRRKREIQNKIAKVVENIGVISAKFLSGSAPAKEDYDCLCEAIEIMYRYEYWPCKFIYNVENMLVSCFEAGL